MGQIVAISNQKGGVGKTTTAINLGASLGACEKKVLLVDMDPQANSTAGLGISNPEVLEKQVYQVLLGEKKIQDCLFPTESPNLFVLPASSDLIGFEVEGLELENREFRLKSALLEIQDQFDVVLMDCPPSLGLLTINSLVAANGVLVPLQAEYFALEGLARLMETIELVSQRLNPQLSIEGIVLTMFDGRNNLSHQVAKEVEQHFGSKVWLTRIPRNVRLSEAPSFGKPILTYDIRSVGAQSYLALAEEFLKRSNLKKGGIHDRAQSTGARDLVADPQLSADASQP